MANSSVTTALGAVFDTETVSSNGDNRQVICWGDKSTEGGVAPVDGTAGGAVHLRAFTTGGCSIYHLVAAASTNAQNVKASAGQVYAVSVTNRSAGQVPIFVKFHNTAGAPTAGAGVVMTVGVQAGTDRVVEFASGVTFATGIGLSIVKGIADSDTTAVAASDCVVDVFYK